MERSLYVDMLWTWKWCGNLWVVHFLIYYACGFCMQEWMTDPLELGFGFSWETNSVSTISNKYFPNILTEYRFA